MSKQEPDLENLEEVGPSTKQKLLDAGIHDVLELSQKPLRPFGYHWD